MYTFVKVKFPVFKTFPDELCRRNTMFLMNSRLHETSEEISAPSFKRTITNPLESVNGYAETEMIMGLLRNENVLYSFRKMTVLFSVFFFFGWGGGVQCSALRIWFAITVDNLFKIQISYLFLN